MLLYLTQEMLNLDKLILVLEWDVCNVQKQILEMQLVLTMVLFDPMTRNYKSTPFSFTLLHYRLLFFFQLHDVAKLAITLKKIQPNLAIDQIGKQKVLRTLSYFGYLLQPVVEIFQRLFLKIEFGQLGPIFSQNSFICVSKS